MNFIQSWFFLFFLFYEFIYSSFFLWILLIYFFLKFFSVAFFENHLHVFVLNKLMMKKGLSPYLFGHVLNEQKAIVYFYSNEVQLFGVHFSTVNLSMYLNID